MEYSDTEHPALRIKLLIERQDTGVSSHSPRLRYLPPFTEVGGETADRTNQTS
jgi:hypothetical protein